MILLLIPYSLHAKEQDHFDLCYLAHTDHYWQVWIMNIQTKSVRQLTHSRGDKTKASWIPGQNALLVSSTQNHPTRVDIRTGKETAYTWIPRGVSDATVSPDGRWIAYSVRAHGSLDGNDIWLVSDDGSQRKRITKMKWLQHDPAWSADSGSIYFHSGAGRQEHDIWRIDIQTLKMEQLTVGVLYNFDVDVSSTGQLIYSSNRSGNYDIWLQDLSNESVQLTQWAGLDANPTWAPDGNQFVFESNRGGVVNLWHFRLQDRTIHPLTNTLFGARTPEWRLPQERL